MSDTTYINAKGTLFHLITHGVRQVPKHESLR